MQQYIEYKKRLPSPLVIPYYRSNYSLEEDEDKDYTDREAYAGELTKEGFLRLYSKREDCIVKTTEDFLSLFTKYRHSILVIPKELVTLLWKGFPVYFQISMAELVGEGIDYAGYTITRSTPNKISIRQGNKWNTIWIYSVKGLLDSIDPETYVKEFLEELPRLTGIQPSSFSLSQTGRNFLFGLGEGGDKYEAIRQEFSLITKLHKGNITILEDFYSACKRPIMASRSIGELNNCWNEDIVKAYLEALSWCPTMNSHLTYYDSSTCYNPDANHAVYKVEVVMPSLWTFAPHTFRGGDDTEGYGTYSPTGGPQICLIGQERARLWTSLGLPFKVYEAFKILPINSKYSYKEFRPFKERSRMLEYIINTYKDKLASIYFKSFYTNSIGSLLTTYSKFSITGEDRYQSLDIFNPILVLFIYEWTANRTWERLIVHPPEYQQSLRVDATTIVDYEGFKLDKSGLFMAQTSTPFPMFSVNPRQKDKNLLLSTHYRDIVKKAADKGLSEAYEEKEIVGTLGMVHTLQIKPENYGKLVNIKYRLSLGGENRVAKKYSKVLPKDLIDNKIELVDPIISQVSRLESSKLPVRSYKLDE